MVDEPDFWQEEIDRQKRVDKYIKICLLLALAIGSGIIINWLALPR